MPSKSIVLNSSAAFQQAGLSGIRKSLGKFTEMTSVHGGGGQRAQKDGLEGIGVCFRIK